jgi:hypothetical protein
MNTLSDTPSPSFNGSDDDLVKEAKKRFTRCEDWEFVARKRFIEDTKFVNGDSDNLYQWPDILRSARGYGTDQERPCLTINKTRQHCLQIINDARQNKTSVKFKPVGGRASFEAAQVLEGLMRHIEYISDAQSAYATATRHQVEGGIGYLRVVTDYAGPDTFDQEIFIRRVKNPLTIYVDPDFQEADGSDMRFAFVFEDVPKDEFEARYPDLKDIAKVALDNRDGWMAEDHIRVAEYFRRRETKDRLVQFTNPESNEPVQVRESKLGPELKSLFEQVIDDPMTQWREVVENEVQWFLIAGDRVIERRLWPGRYIPIIRVPGEETVIDGELDRKGHVRALKDAQRMYNWNNSVQIEYSALQTKNPWVAPAEAIEGYETYWSEANIDNYSVLPYNGLDDAGNQIAAPQRTMPPQAAPAFQVGLQTAANDMMLVSGQYQADFGAPSNERSGVAIQQRQRQGATATYHYIDHLAMAIRFLGKIVLDLIPKIYDTPRLVKIMAEDGSDSSVLIDPNAQQAYVEQQIKNQEVAKQVIFNPNIGRYDVMSDVGPDYATRRQEAFNALSQIAQANSELMGVIGDLLFKSADFEYADQIAQRLERLVPPAAKGDEVDPAVIGLQQQLQTAQGLINTLSQKLQEAGGKQQHADEEAKIRWFEANTKRAEVVLKYFGASAEARAEMDRDMALGTHQTFLEMLKTEHAAAVQSQYAPPQQEAA